MCSYSFDIDQVSVEYKRKNIKLYSMYNQRGKRSKLVKMHKELGFQTIFRDRFRWEWRVVVAGGGGRGVEVE